MTNYTIQEMAGMMSAQRFGNHESTIAFLLTDSRSLSFAGETLFFALKTVRNDGSRFIPELYRRGVRNFVVESLPPDYGSLYPDANFLQTPNVLRSLQQLAESHRRRFDIPVIGITGSNGKTIVKEWISRLLAPEKRVTRSPKSYNSQIGVPLSAWLIGSQSEVAVIEAGISKPGEMDTLQRIIRPTVGILTNIGAAHQENFSSMEEKCREKLRLFHHTEAFIYKQDDTLIHRIVVEEGLQSKSIGWSTTDTQATCYISDIRKMATYTIISYHYQGLVGSYRLPFIDEASIENSIACAIIALRFGIGSNALADGMARLEPVAMRLEVKEGQHGCTLINDSYNSDINSLSIALDFMNRRPDHNGRKRTLILSDIFESGMDETQLYQTVADLVKLHGVEKFIGIGPRISSQSGVIEIADKHFFPTCEDFIGSQVFAGLRNEVILLKGARPFHFDRLTDLLVKKVHETILEVNLNAVVDNLNFYRSFLRPDTKLACMIKADGYGAGAVEIAKTLQEHRVDYLAVAVADEGATLRRNGITADIMVMNPEMSAFKTLFDYRLEPEVYSFRLLDALVKAAKQEGITGYPVHIKLDTGMHRLGFDPNHDVEELITRLQRQSAVIPCSVFSHFVGADSEDFDTFSAHQFKLFQQAATAIQAAFSHKILFHMDNSAGIEHFPERQMDMCRLGIGLYGIDSCDNRILHNVCTLKTTILQMRRVPKEETVGYSRKGILKRDSTIAAIPIGYADGLNRALGRGNAYCLVHGKKAPYVGNICMDVAMIDVTDIDCREGDRVEIFGDNLPVTVLSDALGTIPYEVLTGISNRVKRVYFQD
ncbi:MAG: bifunctional UDP-N-acetylmuramoyl-tripeptide:D-alanyl-D-alanine ligase/alanine racemase [Prevotella sp.]|nr:bifunctional UDP-N-acetylmuramoyl-tripeptide:D-alanyl-D-alanine ligase/alanine racemase [Prevotella sp.]